MNKQRNIFIGLYLISYIGFSFGMTQFTPYLAKLGYLEWQRGLLLSSYAITTILFQLFFGYVSDHFQTIKKFALLAFAVFSVSTAVFYMPVRPNFLLHISFIAVSGGIINTCCGLYDIWILSSEEQLSSHLSFVKAFGSIGWGIGSMLLTIIIKEFNYSGLSIAILCVGGVGLILILISQDIVLTKQPRIRIGINDYYHLMKNKRYMMLVVILFLMYCVIICNNSAVVDRMIFLGASDRQIALKWTIQSLIEIPTYLAGSYLLKECNHYSLLKISAFALSVQFILFGLVDQIWIMTALGFMQIFTTPLLLITSKTLIYQLTPTHMKSTGQLFALSVFTGVSALLVPATAGIITSVFGAKMTLFLAAIIAVAAFGLIFKLQKMK